MRRDRSPSSVLGWLSTSANYTVVTSAAPVEYRQATSPQRTEACRSEGARTKSDGSLLAPCTRKNLVETT